MSAFILRRATRTLLPTDFSFPNNESDDRQSVTVQFPVPFHQTRPSRQSEYMPSPQRQNVNTTCRNFP